MPCCEGGGCEGGSCRQREVSDASVVYFLADQQHASYIPPQHVFGTEDDENKLVLAKRWARVGVSHPARWEAIR
jgi:hypothetical protein